MTARTHVYVMTHSPTQTGKYGIADLDSWRIAEHESRGWRLYRAVLMPSRRAALQVERIVKVRLRADGVSARMPADRMPQHGHSETVNLDEVPAPDLWKRVLDAAGEVEAQADASRVVLFLAIREGDYYLVVGTDTPLGPSLGSPECVPGAQLAADGWLVYAANTTVAAAQEALRGLRAWAATSDAIDSEVSCAEEWPVPMLRNIYELTDTADDVLGQARIAIGVQLNRILADA